MALLSAVMATVGCSSSSETATPTTVAPAVTSTDAPTTTDEPASTTTPGAAAGAAALGSRSGSDSTTERNTTGGADAPTDADVVAEAVSWSLTASEYQGDDGLLVAYDCPPDGAVGTVWGTGVYTDDSSVCSAAVHAGLITESDGGEVIIEISAGLDAYDASTANGVTSLAYGSWAGSFSFADS